MEDLKKLGYSTIADLFGRFKKDKIKGFRPIPQKVLVKIATALDKLHRLGIVHYDAHPGNVFFNPKTYDVKIIDFGNSDRFATRKEAFDNEIFRFRTWNRASRKNKIPTEWPKLRSIIKGFY